MAKHQDIAPLPFLTQGFGWGYVHRRFDVDRVWQFMRLVSSDRATCYAVMDDGSGWMIADPKVSQGRRWFL